MVMNFEQTQFRNWGQPPYSTVLLHGGPGAAGSLTSLANELSQNNIGVIEPFQTKRSIQAQVDELFDVIKQNAQSPVVLIGHSWGAWLGIFFTTQHSEYVEKLILIGTPPFDKDFVPTILKTRESRMSGLEKEQMENIIKGMETNPDDSFQKMGELMNRIDSYDLLQIDDKIDFRPDIYTSIWKEAGILRRENKLLNFLVRINCPVIAIHGDYDPHPWQGVKFLLEERISAFRFIFLEKCGHYPWKEKFARELFLEKLIGEILEIPTP
jgi:pimeloyl-ACP methyl ester carboxylesterase